MKKLLAALIALAAITLTAQIPQRLNDSTFVYPCIASDSTTSLNFVGLPLETGWTMASDLDPSGTNIDAVSRFKQGCNYLEWETAAHHPALGWIKDFPVETGGAYLISAKNDFDFTVTGDSVAISYNFLETYNSIILPLNKSAIKTCSDLGRETNYINAVHRYNNSAQLWDSSYKSSFGWANNFSIYVAQPLIVNSWDTFTWPTYKNSIAISGASDSNTPKGLNGGGPRIVFCHLTESAGRELTEDEMKLIQFEAFITARPTEILDENSYDCGFMHINGMSVLYVNLGNYPTPWSSGEQLSISDVNFDPGYGFDIILGIDNSSSPMFFGFEDQIPGSGTPWAVDMDAIVPLTGVDVTVREESGNIVLEWGYAGEGVTGYNIYASDDPYGTFSYVATTTNLSWSMAVTEDKKFFYVVSTNAKSSVPQKTITVKEKK
jgi:hypothetical protein